MTSSITFETAAFADAIKKAVKVAPTRGSAFDKANGILLEFDPTGAMELCVIRATNIDLFSMEWITVADMSGEPARWRLPAALMGMVVTSLPIGTDKTVTLYSEVTDHGYVIKMVSDNTKVKFQPLDPDLYPTWGAFDPDHMYPATDLGGRIDMVEWAASKSNPELAGVYLNGSIVAATDSYRLAVAPLSIPDLDSPICVPAGLIGSMLRATGDVQIGVSGNFLNIMPDQYSQMRSIVMVSKYPPIQRIMDTPLSHSFTINSEHLLEVMSRINSFSLGDRVAPFRIFLGDECLIIGMVNESVGTIQDKIELPGQVLHERMELKFTPKNIMEALQKSPNKEIEVSYNPGSEKTVVRINGGSGYQCWAAPRVGLSEAKNE